MTSNTETDYREERIQLHERIRNADSETERREAILRLAEINREFTQKPTLNSRVSDKEMNGK